MISRVLNKIKDKLLFTFIFLIMFSTTCYIYMMYLQEYYKNIEFSEHRCKSELASMKYQLTVITEYKNRIDKQLTETQKAHDADKEKYRDIIESCDTMKQQSLLCQSQFDDLEVECKKVKESLVKVTKELETFKTVR